MLFCPTRKAETITKSHRFKQLQNLKQDLRPGKHISKVGRESMIKAVVQAIPTQLLHGHLPHSDNSMRGNGENDRLL